MSQKILQLEQINAKLLHFEPVKKVSVPGTGWIKAIRTAIGMSLSQMGNRLGITKQSAQEIEVRD